MNIEPLKIEYFPSGERPKIQHTNVGEFSSYDIKLSNILCFTPSFIKDIQQARTEIGLEKPFDYPANAAINDILRVFSKIRKHRKELKNLAESLAKKYDLQSNWIISIEVAILMDTLLVPESLGPIQITYVGASPFVEWIKEVKEPELREYLFTKRLLEAYQYPAIRFIRKVSRNELRDWLDSHNAEFEKMQEHLPDKRKIKMEEDSVYWGYLAECYVEVTGKKEYQPLLDYYADNEDAFFANMPSAEELRNFHEEYLATIQKFNRS